MDVRLFWEYLCNDMGYRLFSGVPCRELNVLYNSMDKGVMHYIPAANEGIAVGIVNGATMIGNKAAAIMDHRLLNKIDLDFNMRNKIPLLVVSSSAIIGATNKKLKYVKVNSNYKKCISTALGSLKNESNKIVVLLFNEDILK